MFRRSSAMILRFRHADNVSVRADNDPGRADVVGAAGGFVHGEEIKVGTGADEVQEATGKRVRGLFGRQEGRRTSRAFGGHPRQRPRDRGPQGGTPIGSSAGVAFGGSP
jgi:hypothetical protein